MSVAIAVEFQDALAPASGAFGVVTDVAVSPGDVISTGTRLAGVNNQPIIAYVDAQPLWRDIARGAEGADVTAAQRLLKTFGHYSGPLDGKAGYGTEKAIKAFNRSLGLGKTNGVMALANLAWVGTEPVTVATVSVRAGDQVSGGSELFTTTASLAAIVVTETPNVPRDAAILLDVNGVVIAYVAGSGRVTDADAVAAIAASLGTATEGVGEVRLAQPLTVGTVPSSAVMSDANGTTCVFADQTSPPLPVEPQGGSLGTIELDPSLIGQPILVNPREVRTDLSCG